MTGTSLKLIVGIGVLSVLLTGPARASSAGPPAEPSELIGHAEKDPPPGKPAVSKAWVRSDRWADSRTPESFARDVLRLEADRIRSDEDKAVMLYHWLTRCFARSAASKEGPKGMEGGMVNQWKDFHCYGQGLCDRWGRLGASIARAAGMPARKVTSGGHTMYEVYYKDRDGKGRWHWFDAHLGRYVYSRDKGHIMGGEELAGDPEVYFNFTRASTPYGVRSPMPVRPRKPRPRELSKRRRWFKRFVYSRIWPNDYDVRMDIPAGGSFTRYWSRKNGVYYYDQAGAKKFNQMRCRFGYHDPTPPLYDNGTVKDPENYPYWKNYLIDCACGRKSVKPNGHAIFRWKPSLVGVAFGRDAWLCQNMVTDMRTGRPRVHPARAREQGVLIYQVNSPYMIASSKVKARIWRRKANRLTELAFWFSIDGGTSWSVAHTTEGIARGRPFDVEFDLAKPRWDAGKANVYGKNSYLLRIDLLGDDDETDVGLEDLEIETVAPLNMFTLPMLLPGRNAITVEAVSLAPGKELAVTYVWDDPSARGRSVTRKFKKLPGRFTIDVAGKKPQDVRMRSVGLSVEALPQPKREFEAPTTTRP